MRTKARPQNIRWRPVAVISSLCLLCLIFIWGISGWTQSLKIYGTFSVGGSLVFLLLLWFLFFSRLVLKVKFVGLACLAGLCISLYYSVEIREVSGDVMPILAWSWSPKAYETLPDMAAKAKGGRSVEASSGNDYPRFLGAQSTGAIENIRLARDWDTNPPLEKWRIPVGAAWSGFAVKGGLAVTQEQRGETEMVTCYDLADGELIWAHGDPQHFTTTVGGTGPRATPTIAGDRVYTLGALGLLNCLELATGKLIWQIPIAKDNSAEMPNWGYSGSPLVIVAPDGRELVVVSPGGPDGRSLVAYQAVDGSFAWAGGHALAGYSSPQLARLAGTEMIVIFNDGSVAGHDPDDGRVLWEVPWPAGKPCVANPRCLPGDRVLVSTGYGIGAKMYKIKADGPAFSAELVYESPRLKAKFANFMVRGNYAFGLDDGVLTCIDTTTGERAWKKGRYGHGQLLLAGDLLLVLAEDGELHLIEARPEAHNPLVGIPILSGKSWNTLALAGNLLLLRNHKEAVCMELPLEPSAGKP